ncbi:MAG: hypothetical protein ACI351_04575 [Candidatus Avelusimicrobium sp.]|uniref:hypothetical protein n=1 Tax=Candidatus Avelusimicrobium sp. TaxID=3048833 RepID=UPI003F10CC8B
MPNVCRPSGGRLRLFIFAALALAQYEQPFKQSYYIWISREEPNKTKCTTYPQVSSIQKQLCDQLNQNGTL